MKTSIRIVCIAIAVCVIMAAGSSSVLAWSHNEHQYNNTGQDAHDVVKILEGHYDIPQMMDWDFASYGYSQTYLNGKPVTVLRWWDGIVSPGTAGDVCFTATAPGEGQPNPHAKIIGAWWTGPDGLPIGQYYPALSAKIDFADLANPVVEIGNHQAAQIDVNNLNPNAWADGDFTLTGDAAPMNVHKVWAAVIDGALGPEDLFVEKTIFDDGPGGLADSFFDVFVEVDIPGGNIMNQALGMPVQLGQSVVVVADLGGGNYDLFNFEVIPEPCSMLVLGLGCLGILRQSRKQ